MNLPRFTPMLLARFDVPFEHPDWIFEPKFDGFRAVAYIEGGACRLVSRNRNAFKSFELLAQAVGQELSGRCAILDGEIVRSGPDGRPMFYELSYSYQSAADRMNISVNTVRNYVRSIYEKLHVHSKSEAVNKPLRQGLID